jgi:putative ABC transport system substrate-binding protein
MSRRRHNPIKTGFAHGAILVFLLATGTPVQVSAEIFTIGIINHVAIHTPAINGFKAGMAELGYVEGRDVNFIYNGIVEGIPGKIDAEIRNILAQDVDLFFTAGNMATLRVKMAVEGRLPVLFASGSQPVKDGLVRSLNRPGWNLTGTRVPETAPKLLEWLLKIDPDTRRVFLPFNPDDEVSVIVLNGIKDKVARLGIELVLRELSSVEAAKDAILQLPEDIDAILRIPSPTLDARNRELSRVAIDRRLPMVASLPLDKEVFLTCGADFFEAGRQNARLAHLIIRGASPADLPVETTDPALTINLITADKIGIYVPDAVLLQAENIIR